MNNRASVLTGLFLASVLALTGCTAAPGDGAGHGDTAPGASAEGENLLAEHNLGGLDAKHIIDRLDALAVAERPNDIFASVRAESLVVSSADGREVTLPMPNDEFYVSMAPYVTHTHECYFHSLTTCLGELNNEDVHVKIVDSAGAVVIDGTYRTFSNGFLGLWLPRDMTATITIEHEGLSVTAPLSTTADDPTCVTTLQLS